jgi:hypothetical protein
MKHTRETYASVGSDAQERSDCSIRAAATAGCIDYNTAHAVFEKHGRKPCKPTRFETSMSALKELFPESEFRTFHGRRVTLAQFVRAFPAGHYVLHVRGHALAVCDGVVHDWTPASRRLVRWYWKLA